MLTSLFLVLLSRSAEATPTRVALRFTTLVIPRIERSLGLNFEKPQIQFENLGKTYQGYFDPKEPNKIKINPHLPSGEILPDLVLATNLVHEYQHFVLLRVNPNVSWELNELLSLLWQYLFLGEWNKEDVRSTLKVIGPVNLWQFKKDERVTYGRLSLIGYTLFYQCGEWGWMRKLYGETLQKTGQINDLLVSCGKTPQQISDLIFQSVKELKK